MTVEFFVYGRDRPATEQLRSDLLEAHWAYMDHYAEAMVARGPTLTEDRQVATGSLHIVDLPDADAAHAFAHDEPNFRAGVYADVVVRRWRNDLGRTMWDVAATGDPGFLFIAPTVVASPVLAGHRLIVCGPLLDDDGATATGSAGLFETADPAKVAALLPAGTQVLPWERGGRR